MKSWKSTILLFLCALANTFAQTGRVEGSVVDAEGKAVPFVSIQLLELRKGQKTDENGRFVLDKIKAGNYTMVASFVGFKTLNKAIKIEDQKTVHLALELFENSETLKEIVVRGYVSPNERIASVGKMAVKPMDLPIALQTIDRQVLESQQVSSLQDVLMNTNGVYIMGSTGGYQEEIAGRGFSYGSTNTFKNGSRYINSMMPELSSLERVEVLKGSAAMLYGNVAAGGVINLITKKPRFDFGGEAGLRVGSFGMIKPTIDIYGGLGKNLAYRMNGSWQQANSFRQFVSSERTSFNPSLLIKLGKKTEFLAEADYLKDSRTPDFGAGIVNYELIPDFPRNRFLGVKWGLVNSQQTAASGTLTHQFNHRWKATATATFRDFSQDLMTNLRPNSGVLIKSDGLWTRSIQKSENDDNYFIAQADFNGSFKTGKINHEVLVGFDTDHFTQTTQAYTPWANYDKISIFSDLSENVRNDVPVLNKANLSVIPNNRWGVYSQDLMSITEKIKLLAGLRYSNQRSESLVTTASGQTTTTVNPQVGAFSPRAGLLVQPNKKHSLFGSYSNSFALNTGVDIEGKALPPSIIDQYEVGLKNEFLNGKMSANVTVYQIDNDNLAQISLANGNTNATIRELTGAVRSKGLELDFSARPVPNLNLMAGYSYNETRYTQSNTFVVGSLLRYNPNHTANASLQYKWYEGPLKNTQLGLTSVYIGKRYAGRSTRVQIANDAFRLTEIAPYAQLDATAAYAIKRVHIKGKVGNVLNVLSYNVHDDNSVNPIAPRNYSVTISYKI